MMNLNSLGWNDFFSSAFKKYKNRNYGYARVSIEATNKFIMSPAELSESLNEKEILLITFLFGKIL